MSFVMQLRGYPPRTPYKTSWSGETPDTPCQGDPDTPSGIGFVSQICKFANSLAHALNLKLNLKFLAMFANVQPTRSLKSSLYYDRALRHPEKGGKVIMANGVGLNMSPTAQLAMLEAYVNPKFKVKAYSVVISHSDEDNERLKDPKFRELMLHEFVNECKNRGIDLDNIPYIIPEHTNTDNDHYHMLMLINHFDKHQASGATTEEEGRKRKPRTRTANTTKPVVPSVMVGLSEEEQKKLNDRIRRQRAIQEAQKRKEDEAKRQAERDAKERTKVQKQEAERGKKNGQGNDKPEAERENKPRFKR